MITWQDLYNVLTAVIPLYVPLILAYGSVRWWQLLTADQCSGISRFVSMFAVPFLIFHLIHTNNPYAMNFQFIAADSLQKIAVIVVLGLWTKLSKNGSLEWMITAFSLSTIPNMLVVGVPLLVAMYGEFSGSLMIQMVVMQCIVWYNVLVFFFEYRAAKMLVMKCFRKTAASIASFRVESDVVSLGHHDILETESEIGDDGMLHVTVKKAISSRQSLGPRSFSVPNTGRNPQLQSQAHSQSERHPQRLILSQSNRRPIANDSHVFVESTRISHVPETGGPPASSSAHFDAWEESGRSVPHVNEINTVATDKAISGTENIDREDFSFDDGRDKNEKEERETKGLESLYNLDSISTVEIHSKVVEGHDSNVGTQMPPVTVITRLILIMVWRKLIRNPSTYSSLGGLIWSLISFRWHVTFPKIIEQSITIVSNTSLGMIMFSLGLFMALQPKMISCGYKIAAFSMAVRFFIGPAVMAVVSIAIGIRGTLLRVAIVQAALPQGLVPFVYAREYGVHPTILSIGVIFGVFIGLPIILVYYIVIGF